MKNPPLLAYHNQEFMDSEAGRALRILAEYEHPLRSLDSLDVKGTIVFFGSARLQESGPLGRYYQEARTLARLITEWSCTCHAQRYLVCTGGGGGIMEAANRGAADAGGRSIGFNIGLPFEQRPNSFITPELGFEFHYFFMRKLWFAHTARAMIVFPGGLGTLDELFEILTLTQTQKIARQIPIFIYGREYWEKIINFKALADHNMISSDDFNLFEYVESPEEAFDRVTTNIRIAPDKDAPCFAKSNTCCCGTGSTK